MNTKTNRNSVQPTVRNLRKHFLPLLLAVTGLLAGGSVSFGAVAFDADFSTYTLGGLNTQNSWVQVSSGTNIADPIQVIVASGAVPQSIRITGVANAANSFRDLPSASRFDPSTGTQAKTFYYVLENFKVIAAFNSTTSTGQGFCAFTATAGGTGSTAARLFLRRFAGITANTTTFDLGVSASGATPVYGANALAVGTLYKIVVAYTANPGAANDVVKVYVNPVGLDPATWSHEVTQTATTDPTTSFKSFAITPGAVNNNTKADLTIGRIIVGDTPSEVLPLPAVPTSSAATAPGTGGFTANWAASSGATGYTLNVATDSEFFFPLIGYPKAVGNVTTYTVPGPFTGGTTLYYKVQASNSAGPSQYSLPQSVGITAALLPTVSNGTASGTVTWVDGPGWSPNNPVSATNATVTFNGDLTGGATLTATNNSLGDFQLNSLVFSNRVTGTGTVNVIGNPFRFSANGTTNPTITFTNTNSLVQKVSNALQLDATLTVSQPGSSTVNSILEGVISGTSGMTKSGSGFVHLTGTNNSFSGGVTVGNGTLVVGNIGMAGSNSSLGTNGTITLGAGTISGTLRWGDYATGNEVSDKAISLPGSTGGGTIDVRGNNLLTLNGNIDTGANTSLRNLNLYSSGEYVNPDGTSNSIVINGLISGNGGLSITGTGTSHTYVLNNIDNSFGGPLSLVGSTSGGFYRLRITKFGNAGATSSIGKSGVVNIGGTHNGANNMLYYWGSGEDTDKTLNLSGTVGNAAIVNKGAGTLKFVNPVTATGSGNKTIFPDEDELTGVIEFAGNIPDSLGGTTAIKKAGVGKLVLSANNTFTGGMRLAGGTLELKHSSALATGNYLRFETQATNGVALVKIGYAGNGPALGNLEVRVDATIDLGTDATASIRFATATGWYADKILTVANSTGGGKMYIDSSVGLNLNQIKSLEEPTWPASLDANGLLTFTDPAPVNTAPTITSGGAFSVPEKSTAVTTVGATDAEANTLTYTILSGSDADKFWIGSGTGVLTFLSAPDYEIPTDLGSNNVYNLTVVVSDGLLTAQKDIVVTVTNVSDSPADYKTDWLTANSLPSGSSWNSDPNNVGYSLATAYAFGLSPSVHSGAPVALASSPAGSVKIVYLQREDISGVTYTVKSGTDLAAGLNGTEIPQASANQPVPGKPGYTQYEATYTPPAPATRGFLKVQALVP